jgi:hypothetical protein
MITMQMKALFLDRPAVQRAVNKAKRAALSKAGAFIRTTARHSLRRKKVAAPPGQPPHSHVGLLKRFLFFAYEPASESVVIGPAKLEHGGKTLVERRRRGKVVRCRLTIESRPFMGPALEKERPKLPKRWAGSVRGG